MRLLFAGSPAIAVPSMEAAAKAAELAAVLTNPDSPRGRSGKCEPTEAAVAAGRLSVPVLKPEKLDRAAREAVRALEPDLLVSFAYGRIFGPKFLSLFPLGGINIHPSLLPRYRGPSPIAEAILNGDEETGVTIQRLAPEMDSGDILAQEIIPLEGRETSESLSLTAALKSAAMLPPLLEAVADGSARGRPQNHGEAVYCSLVSREDGIIDWTAGAAAIDARIRAFTPWPLCRTSCNGTDLYILRAHPAHPPPAPHGAAPGLVLGVDKRHGILIQTGDGVLAAEALQFEKRKALEWRVFLNGARDFIGTRLGAGRAQAAKEHERGKP
ncbi:MAG: methionyl-tRNA formyltransferase [Treponema sp.]|jgi:methionyl-tRNA formyltransferase|nr:methionyl-tRNA formyltransferase [Treponema sp.]